jgi:hypothetical protein
MSARLAVEVLSGAAISREISYGILVICFNGCDEWDATFGAIPHHRLVEGIDPTDALAPAAASLRLGEAARLFFVNILA